MIQNKLEDFDYNLPKELIAYYPADAREKSRLLVLNRKDKTINSGHFEDVISFLRKGDVLVRNISKVIPARLYAKRKTGGRVEILFLNLPDSLEAAVLLKTRGRLTINEQIILPGGSSAEYLGAKDGFKTLKFSEIPDIGYLIKYGQMPLPPYIKRSSVELDKERYQTVYAKEPGSVAAPTAGLHFSRGLIDNIKSKGIEILDVILHIGYATFKPLTNAEIEQGKLQAEYFEIPKSSADRINKAKKEQRRVIAIGTTTVRALESQAYSEKQGSRVKGQGSKGKRQVVMVEKGKGQTDLFIRPGYRFKIVDGLITNFHLPRTSLLFLVSAFCGRDFMLSAYKYAVDNKFRFYSYGDAMFIE
ncbi:MAG: tRNA preQ1(34) S-adenosylmethionine ribosyltransferase-isomerase QueA [Candidatus Omnitrophica bacterium]|nr:tRNA preQ1(34) S-adenosylmethionine ribosyltransferase-isomerase QueA [Candidatus Omnitrophota bacterium]